MQQHDAFNPPLTSAEDQAIVILFRNGEQKDCIGYFQSPWHSVRQRIISDIQEAADTSDLILSIKRIGTNDPFVELDTFFNRDYFREARKVNAFCISSQKECKPLFI